MRLALPNEIGGPVKSRNVIAEIKGSNRPEEIVLLGAHLDSWDMGSGCLDNAVNAVLVLEAARAILDSADRPRRTIRFALFSGEEAGLFGSLAYVQTHRNELDRFSAVLVHDMGLGKISGYAVNGRPELEEPLREAMTALGSRASDHTTEAFFGSDHFDFLLEGVPALVAMQDTSDYTATYHSAADTFDKVRIPELRDRAQIAALTVLGIANLPEKLGKRLSREEVGYLLDDTGIDDQMKFLRLWDQWESGERGRQ
jgi:Zn-dependent M28 family amino/carboxypeptidase